MAFSAFLVRGNHTGTEESLGIVEKRIEYPFVIIVDTATLAPNLAQPPHSLRGLLGAWLQQHRESCVVGRGVKSVS